MSKGKLPTEIGSLINLQNIYLYSNDFSGIIYYYYYYHYYCCYYYFTHPCILIYLLYTYVIIYIILDIIYNTIFCNNYNHKLKEPFLLK